jgi:hypothetical protein
MASKNAAPEAHIGRHIERALEEQRRALFEVQAIIDSVAAALALHARAASWPGDMPHFHLALQRASKCLEPVTEALELITLQGRAAELARTAADVSHG